MVVFGKADRGALLRLLEAYRNQGAQDYADGKVGIVKIVPLWYAESGHNHNAQEDMLPTLAVYGGE